MIRHREYYVFHQMKCHSFICLLVGCLVLFAGCSTAHYKASADREVYGIITQKSPQVPGMPEHFTIDKSTDDPVASAAPAPEPPQFLGEAGQAEKDGKVITLEMALNLAVTHSRTYQNQKDQLYLRALALTLDRHRFAPIFSGTGSAEYKRSTTDVAKLHGPGLVAQAVPGLIGAAGGNADTALGTANTASAFLQQLGVPPNSTTVALLDAVGSLAGTPGQLLGDYANVLNEAFTVTGINQPRNEIRDERSVSGNTNLGVSMLLKGGAQIAINLTSNFLRFLTGDPNVNTSSALIGSITQPLLRGRGKAVTTEVLTQSERNVLYELRTFTRFRQDFAVQVASTYYSVLQSRDAIQNNWRGYQAFKASTTRARALAEANRMTQAELGRFEQSELNAENSWVDSIRNYKQSLDQFKILLGLPTDANVILDDHELDTLREQGIVHPTVTTEEAIKVADVARIDLYNTRDELDDAKRKVVVAANALKPKLDLVVTGQADSEPGADKFNTLDFRRAVWSAGFDVDLPFDRKAERNAYRTTLISYDRAERDLSLADDQVKLDVRQAWRNLDQAKRNFENRKLALDLAERRVEEQNLRAELGVATAIDQVDAQNDFISAQNELTDALVRHTIARLEFWRDMGILYIKENGQWKDVNDVRPNPS